MLLLANLCLSEMRAFNFCQIGKKLTKVQDMAVAYKTSKIVYGGESMVMNSGISPVMTRMMTSFKD